MSKQQQAPGDLELVRAFVNTVDTEEGEERLQSGSALATWLTEHGLAGDGLHATSRELANAVELREALRAILLSHNTGSPAPAAAVTALDAAACRGRLRLRFDERATATLESQAGGVDGALGQLLAIVHAAMAQGTWKRLKACREHACEWAFYDHTKNHSGAWCNMGVCGNRAKARAYRERRAAPDVH
jgi:predicted RNA-binding Zn ribbon-like protein